MPRIAATLILAATLIAGTSAASLADGTQTTQVSKTRTADKVHKQIMDYLKS